jgi:hypothetical protein
MRERINIHISSHSERTASRVLRLSARVPPHDARNLTRSRTCWLVPNAYTDSPSARDDEAPLARSHSCGDGGIRICLPLFWPTSSPPGALVVVVVVVVPASSTTPSPTSSPRRRRLPRHAPRRPVSATPAQSASHVALPVSRIRLRRARERFLARASRVSPLAAQPCSSLCEVMHYSPRGTPCLLLVQ